MGGCLSILAEAALAEATVLPLPTFRLAPSASSACPVLPPETLAGTAPLLVAAMALPLLHLLLGLALAVWMLLFLFRIVLTWYPQVDLQRGGWRLLHGPTEPLLAPTRRWVAPMGGVDVTPVIWLGLVSLLRELLVGQQGLLTMVIR